MVDKDLKDWFCCGLVFQQAAEVVMRLWHMGRLWTRKRLILIPTVVFFFFHFFTFSSLSLRALSRCEEMIQRYSRELNSDGAMVGKAVEDCMRAIIGVLLNLTHDNGQCEHSGRVRTQLFLCLTAVCTHVLTCVCVCRVGQYKDGRTRGFNSHCSELCSQSSSVSSTRAEVRRPSTGK